MPCAPMMLTFIAVLLAPHALPPPRESCWGPLATSQIVTTRTVTEYHGVVRRPDVVVTCSNDSDCTTDIQSALDDASNRTLIFRGTYVTTPLLLRANNTLLHFAPGSLLIAKKGAFIGGADSLFTIQVNTPAYTVVDRLASQ